MSSKVEAKYVRYMSSFSGREARVLRVGKSLTAPFRQIADAIRASRPYDRVEVESGKYFEALSINHPLELCSAGDGEPPVVTCRGPCLTIKTEGPVLVDSMTIIAKGTRASDSQSIVIDCGKPVIRSCDLSSVYVMNDAAPQITHCRICNSDYGCGLAITRASGGVYANNDISGHNEEAIRICSSGRPTLKHNRVTQKPGTSSTVVVISGRLLESCEPLFHDNIIRGTTVAAEYLDPYATHSPEMLVEEDPRRSPCLVRVNSGAAPLLVGNLLSNGITGFHFSQCTLPPDRFYGNRIINCVAWGITIGEETSLVVQGNDVRCCGGGIRVSTLSALSISDKKKEGKPRVTLLQCNMQKTHHYGILIDRSVVAVSECNIVKSSIGIVFLGNCSACEVSRNTISENSTAAFSIMRRGVATIEANTVSGIDGESMYGVFVLDSSTVTLRSNSMTGMGTSIYVRDGSHLVAEKNVLRNASVHHIVLVEGSHATLNENTIECSLCAAVVVTEESQSTMLNNVMYSSMKEGVLVEYKSKVTLKGNGMSSMREGIYIRHGAQALVEENDIAQSHIGLVVEGNGSTCVAQSNRFRGMRSVAAHAFDYANLTACENTVLDQSALGFKATGGATVLLERNTVRRCAEGAVCVDGPETRCRVVDCCVDDVGYGILCTGRSHSTVTGNTLRGCTSFGVRCGSDGETIVRSNRMEGSGIGILLAARGDVCDNVTDDCSVGVAALPKASAALRDHCAARCAIGLRIDAGTCVTVKRVVLRHSRNAGVSIDGPAPAVTLHDCAVESSAGVGVSVRTGGACRFERCVVRDGPGAGICLDSLAGSVVFNDCAVVDHARGIMCAGGAAVAVEPAARAMPRPRFERCTVEGAACAIGVDGAAGGAAEFRLCRIRAGIGVGVALAAGSLLSVARCDITDCARAGIAADAQSLAAVEDSTIERCGTGVLFTPGNEIANEEKTEEMASEKTEGEGPGTVLSRVTVRDCPRAGVWCEPRSAGSVCASTVESCGDGVVLEAMCRVALCDTAVRASIACGVRVTGAVAAGTALQRIAISESGAAGVLVEAAAAIESASNNSNGNSIGNDNLESDRVGAVCVEDAEITGNAGGGVVFEATASLVACVVARNGGAGVLCRGPARPLLRACRLAAGAESNLDARDTAFPVLRDCAVEDAVIGVRVGPGAAVRMAGCTARRLGTALEIPAMAHCESSLEDCVFADCRISVAAAADVALQRCTVSDCGLIGIRVARGAKIAMRECTVEAAPDGVMVEAGAAVTVVACKFAGNLRALTAAAAAAIDVRNSAFAQQVHYAISTQDGPGAGMVWMCDNKFSGSAQHSIVLAAAPAKVTIKEEVEGEETEKKKKKSMEVEVEVVVEEKAIFATVCGNTFQRDVCGVLVQETLFVFLYNNVFRDCRTGLVLRTTGPGARIISNTFEGNKCGCHCEENTTAQIWRNTFCANTETGLLSTSGSKPLVVANVFTDHSADAICVRESGAGQFAMNELSRNKSGLLLQDSSDTVMVSNNTFEANHIAVQLAPDASAHVIACAFLSSTLADVSARGAPSATGCALAYNCFASPGAVAVDLAEEAAVLLYRSAVLGAEATGMRVGSGARGVASECLFYDLGHGVIAAEGAEGHVAQCVFVNCTTAVVARALSTTKFHACVFFARQGSKCLASIAPMVEICAEAEPTFLNCSFLSGVADAGVLMRSCGGGCLNDSFFAAAARGNAAVVLEGHCSTTLHHNTFLAGSVGVVLASLSTATVEMNVFHRHELVAVKVTNNACGKLCGNTFAQPIDNGGILAGSHSVTIEANRTGDVGKQGKLPSMEATSLMETFGEWLAEAPQWARKSFGSMPPVAVLPSTLLARLTAEAEPDTNDLSCDKNDAQDDGKQRELQVERQAKGVKRQANTRGEAVKKRSRKSGLKETIAFPVSDAVMEVPQRMNAALLAWAEHSGVALNQAGPASPSLPLSVESSSTAPCASPEVSAIPIANQKAAVEAPVRGDGAAASGTEVRGTSMDVRPSGSSQRVSHSSLCTEGAKTKTKIIEFHDNVHATSPVAVHTITPTQGSACTRDHASTRSKKAKSPTPCSRRALPPPLRSTDVRAQPQRRPARGPIATLTACLKACRASTGPSRAPRTAREDSLADVEIDIDAETEATLLITGVLTASAPRSEDGGESAAEEDTRSTVGADHVRQQSSPRTSESISAQRSPLRGSGWSRSSGSPSPSGSIPRRFRDARSISLRSEGPLGVGDTDSDGSPQRSGARIGPRCGTAIGTDSNTSGTRSCEGISKAAKGDIKDRGAGATPVSLGGNDVDALKNDLPMNTGTIDKAHGALKGSTKVPDSGELNLSDEEAHAKPSPSLARPVGMTQALRQDRDGEEATGTQRKGKLRKSASDGKRKGRRTAAAKKNGNQGEGAVQQAAKGSQSSLEKVLGDDGTATKNVNEKKIKKRNVKFSKSLSHPPSRSVHTLSSGKDAALSPMATTENSNASLHGASAEHMTSAGTGGTALASSSDASRARREPDGVGTSLGDVNSHKQSEREERHDRQGDFSISSDSKDMKNMRSSGEREAPTLMEGSESQSASVAAKGRREGSASQAAAIAAKGRTEGLEASEAAAIAAKGRTEGLEASEAAAIAAKGRTEGSEASEAAAIAAKGRREASEASEAGTMSVEFLDKLSTFGAAGNRNTAVSLDSKSGAGSHATARVRTGDAYGVNRIDSLDETKESVRPSGDSHSSPSGLLSIVTNPSHGTVSTSSSTLPQLTVSSLQSINNFDPGAPPPRIQKLYGAIEAIVRGDASPSAKTSGRKNSLCLADETDSPRAASSRGNQTESDACAEAEDIVALLRWLADMRAQRLLSQARFKEAVSCLRANARVPFYVDEAGGNPTVMVRLPQAPGETVAIPLLGSQIVSHLELPIDLPLCPQPSPQKDSLLPDAPNGTANAWHNDGGVRRAPPPPPHLPPLAHAKAPRGRFMGRTEQPQSREAAEGEWALGGHTVPCVLLQRDDTGEDRRGMRASSGGSSRSRIAHTYAPRGTVAFNPALPLETSPYIKNTRIAAFIAAGTANLKL